MRYVAIALLAGVLGGCHVNRPYGPPEPVEPIDTVVIDTVAIDTVDTVVAPACTAVATRTTWWKRDYCPPNGRSEPNVDTIDGRCYKRRFTYHYHRGRIVDTTYHAERMDFFQARAEARSLAPLLHFRGDSMVISKTSYRYIRGYQGDRVRIEHRLPDWHRYYPWAVLSYDSCGTPVHLHMIDRNWETTWTEWIGFATY